jgi:hypothetical protein
MFELENGGSAQQIKLNFYSAESVFHKLLWHTQVLSCVFGILLMLTASLVFINFHWFSKRLLNVGSWKVKNDFSVTT